MNYQHIRYIANYEIKTLTRDWGFRIIVLFNVLLILFLHLTAQSNIGKPQWVAISLSSSLPYANAWLVNYLQVFMAIFWAGRFMQRGQQIDTIHSILVRPFTNAGYLWGKALGFMAVLLGLDLIWGGTALVVHLFLSDSPFALFPYVFYFFTLTLPTLVFTTGLICCLKGIIRHKALLLLILPGLFYLIIAYGGRFLYGVTDVFASPLPNVFSEIIGFSALSLYLQQRLTFLLWGCGLLTLATIWIDRLPDNARTRYYTGYMALLILIAGSALAWKYTSHHIQEQRLRDAIRGTYVKYGDTIPAHITDHDIQFRQSGASYGATSRFTLLNTHTQPLTPVILFLNPGLEVTAVTMNNEPLTFKRERQAIIINCLLHPQETKEMIIQYHGSPIPEVCYAETKDLRDYDESRSHYFYHLGKEYFYLRPNFTLLTPECLWYPVSQAPINIRSPYMTTQSYTNFQLTVIGEKKRLPISQGTMHVQGDTTRFINRERQTGLSLCIGNYTRKAFTQDSILYEIYLFKGHEYLTEGFGDPQNIIHQWTDNLHLNGREYTFGKLALVETPVHFCAYSRFWRNGSGYVQPEIIFRPEREAFTLAAFRLPSRQSGTKEAEASFLSFFSAYEAHNYGFERSVLSGNLFTDPLSKYPKYKNIKNEYDLSDLLRKQHFYVTSPEFPGINLIFQQMQAYWKTAHRDFQDVNDYVEAISYLNHHSLEEALVSLEDNLLLQQIVRTKSNIFLRRLLCSIPYQELYEFTQGFISRHSFQEMSYEKYGEELKRQSGIDLILLTRQLYSERELPSFLVKDAQIQWVETPLGETGYVQSVKIWNRATWTV